MKIRNKFLISVSVSIAMIIVLGFIVYSTSQEINKSVERQTLSQNIITDVFDLNILRADYLLNPGERAKIQWFSKYESLGQNIKKAEEEEEEWGVVLKNIDQSYDDLKPLFSQLVDYTENPSNRSPELGTRLRGQSLIKSQEIVSISQRLSSIAAARSLYATQRMFIVIIFVAVAGIVMIINSIFVFKSTVKPISQLYKATEALARSKFQTRVDIKTGDEFEQLGKSFNRTAEALGGLDEEHEQLDKSKTEFLSITSHELRSPMTPMKAQLQMLLGNYFGKLNKKQRDALDIILRNTDQLDRIIVDLLEVSRIHAGRLKFNYIKTNLVKGTEDIIKEMKYYVPEKNIELMLKLDKLPIIKTDSDRIAQVLRNLIGNAKKFSPKGSKVFVTAELKDKMIQLSVKDQGIGISPKNQKRIFEPFFQAEKTLYREYGGTGLGLAICKGIVEALGGKIWFESTVGKGSTFYFTVPIKTIKKTQSVFKPSLELAEQRDKMIKEAEEKQRQLNAIKFTLDNSSLVSITDLRGDIIYANSKFIEISKYSMKELIGQNHRIINSGFHSAKFFDNLWKTISSGEVWHGDIRNKAKDGSIYWVRATLMPTLDENGKISGYSAVRTPITDVMGEIEMAIRKIEKGEDVGSEMKEIVEELRTGKYNRYNWFKNKDLR